MSSSATIVLPRRSIRSLLPTLLFTLCVWAGLGAQPGRARAQAFSDIGAGLLGVEYSSVAWGDYDNDGDLDVLLTGYRGSTILPSFVYRNDSGTFVDIGAGLPWSFGSAAWGDYDNDGDLDVLSSDFGVVTNDNGSFVYSDPGLPGTLVGSAAWGDYDNDGDLDVLLTGYDDYSELVRSRVYRNDSGTFVDIVAGLPGVEGSSVAWGDYDSDGDLDVLLTGDTGSGNLSRIYRNDAGTFVDIGAGLPGVSSSSVAWGDYDNDGDLDILMSGFNGAGLRLSRVYRNDAGAFVDTGAGLPGVSSSSVAWGDYDNDGDLDILLTGSTGSEILSRIYRNDAGTFVDIGGGLPGVVRGSVAWGDYDNDGGLDILLTGSTNQGRVSRIYRNNTTAHNTIPNPPTGLSAQRLTGNRATFTWNAATDAQTPSPGLTYNLRIGSTPGGNQISSAMAHSFGYRLVPQLGNTNHRRSWTVTLPPAVRYYWSVQAVDAAWAGSYFADEQTLGVFEASGAGLPDINNGSAAWGDYDNDGDLDVLMTGTSTSGIISRIYRNDGGSFVDLAAGLPGVYYSSVAWGDYDSDGDLDFLLTGYTGSVRLSQIYRNNGGTFVDIGVGLPALDYGSVAWGDYDNDGDLDVLLTGSQGPGGLSRVYRNDSGTFVDIGAGLPGVFFSSVAWGDYDNDGDLDVLLTGSTDTGLLAAVYRNDFGTFVDIGAGLPGVGTSSVAWGDYDNDGDLDFLLTGETGLGAISRIYRNNSGTFTDVGAGLAGVKLGSVVWGDYDNDGDLDVLLTGNSSSGILSRVYSNNGGTFSDMGAGLPSVDYSSVAWGDYDNDGDLDILLTGSADTGFISRIYRNWITTPNAIPSAPTGLLAELVENNQSVTNNRANFRWNAATDAQTPSPGLTYNIRIGTTPGGSQISSAMANSANGYRRVPRLGNTNHGQVWEVTLPPADHYYWSVQAVDAALAGSAFAAEQTLTPPFTDIVAGLPGVQYGSVAWGDYDNDGDLDALLTGDTGSGLISRIYRNDGGTFVDIVAGLPGVSHSSVAWGDFDNDGDLDILLAGSGLARVYRNTNGTFASIGAGLPGVTEGSVAWGDYDNDGDLDFLLTGISAGGVGRISRVYRNNGGIFSDIVAGLPGVNFGSVAWGDYDNDGDLDILLTGFANPARLSRIYRNNGGTFTDIGAGLTGVSGSSVAWGDYDNDGDLDILLTGVAFPSSLTRIYRNDGGTFVDIGTTMLGVSSGSVAWGDYDNDGDLDVLLTGFSSSGRLLRVYSNNGGTFNYIGAGLRQVDNSSVAWGDYDNDGDLDFLVTGNSSSGLLSRVYRNNTSIPNTVPNSPQGLSVGLSGNNATFAWNAATDAQTPSPGLTYNLRVGTTPGGNEILSPIAYLDNGYVPTPRPGNTNHRRSWTIALPAATPFYWSVQAVDGAFAGSPWSYEYSVSAVDAQPELPASVALHASTPNPFRGTTRLAFDLPKPDRVRLNVYDVRGRLVKSLNDDVLPAGRHEATWDGTDGQGQRVGAGVYLVRMEAGVFREARRVVLLP